MVMVCSCNGSGLIMHSKCFLYLFSTY